MLRTALVVGFLILFLIFSSPLMLLERIVYRFNRERADRHSLAVVCWALRVIAALSGVRLTVIGEENVPKDQAVLYVGNHRSFFDIVLSYARVPRPTGYVAKKEMLKVPILSAWMRNLHCLFLDRDDIRQGMQVILDAIELIRSGVSVCIFPEGTRNASDAPLLPFHKGSFKIAQRTNCPIIPMTICHSRDILENHFPAIRRAHVILEYGKPIRYRELSGEEQKNIHEYVAGVIADTWQRNRKLV